jgi:hypothetical protein
VPRRVTAVLLAAVLAGSALASCTKPKDNAGTGSGLTLDGGTTTTGGKGTGTTAAAGTPSTAGRKPTSTTAGSKTPTTDGGGTRPVDSGAKGGAGAYARTVLRPKPAAKVTLDILQQSGAEPLAHTTDHAVQVLSQNSGKAVSLGGPVGVPGGAEAYTAADIRELSDRYGRTAQTEGQAVIRLLFLHGTFDGDRSVLGISVRGDTAAVFVDQVQSTSTPIARRNVIEDAVTEHELGHLLGLVDLVLHTGRGDPDHPGHSTNRASVMYWAVESDLVSQALGGPPPVDFDAADRADLAAIRNGA